MMFSHRFVGKFQDIYRKKIEKILSYLWQQFGNRKSVSQNNLCK